MSARRAVLAVAPSVLWVVNPDGSAIQQLFVALAGRFPTTPTWSPDGSWIMLAIDPTENEDAHPPNGLSVLHADASELTLVLGGDDDKREPEWWNP